MEQNCLNPMQACVDQENAAEKKKLEARGRYNECGNAGKDIYGIEEKAKAHMRKIK